MRGNSERAKSSYGQNIDHLDIKYCCKRCPAVTSMTVTAVDADPLEN